MSRKKYKYITINGKRIAEHRYIMQEHLGRELTSDEIVHHKDGPNNDINNLQLTTRGEHNTLHKSGENNPMYGRTGENHPMYGKRGEDSPNFGKIRSEEDKELYSKTKKEYYKTHDNPFKDRKHTEESKELISKAVKNWLKTNDNVMLNKTGNKHPNWIEGEVCKATIASRKHRSRQRIKNGKGMAYDYNLLRKYGGI